MKGEAFKWGTVVLAVACLISQTTALAQQSAIDRLKSQAPSMLKATPPGKAQGLKDTQALNRKLFAKTRGEGEAKKPENAFYFLGLACVFMNDPQLRTQLSDNIRGALSFVQAPQQLQDLLAEALRESTDQTKLQAFMQQTWQWVQSRGQAPTVNFFAGAWTASNFFALSQQQTFKLEVARNLANFYAQTGPPQAVAILQELAGFSQREVGPNDLKRIGELLNALAQLLM